MPSTTLPICVFPVRCSWIFQEWYRILSLESFLDYRSPTTCRGYVHTAFTSWRLRLLVVEILYVQYQNSVSTADTDISGYLSIDSILNLLIWDGPRSIWIWDASKANQPFQWLIKLAISVPGGVHGAILWRNDDHFEEISLSERALNSNTGFSQVTEVAVTKSISSNFGLMDASDLHILFHPLHTYTITHIINFFDIQCMEI